MDKKFQINKKFEINSQKKFEIHSNLEQKDTRISELEGIYDNRGQEIRKREDLRKIVEAPLLKACESIYDKNIKTRGTSANKKDVGSEAYIIISFDELSKRNQKIGESLGEVFFADDENQLKITFPVTDHTTFAEVEDHFFEISKKFEKQMFRAITYTLEQMRKNFGIDPNDESYAPESFSGEPYGWYWDPELKLFFLSKEQHDKALEEILED